jgi:hypothetical protein
LDFGARLIPVEVKLAATPTPPMAANLTAFRDLFPKQVQQSYLVCLAAKAFRLSAETVVAPFQALS